MTKKELVELLKDLPDNAQVRIDDDTYPEVTEVILSDDMEFDGDPEDAPPKNTILLQLD
jgi:hypothetical protein